MRKEFNLYIIIGLLSFILIGCSERKDDKPLTASVISVHGEGFSNPASSNFHAKFIKTNNYNLQQCQSCHGFDYSGGTTGQTCNTCHNKPNGPENCTTCHGSVNAAPPKDLSGNISPTSRAVGAHQKHYLSSTLHAGISCNECHKTPATFTSVGHIDSSPNAEVRFDSTSMFHKSNAIYNAANVSCANTYCHGNFNGGNNLTVTWNDTSSSVAACGTCHGDATKATIKEKAFPTSGHTAATITSDCSICHSRTVNSSLAIINPSNHVNGKVD